MNKAFVREPDQSEFYCPECGAVGIPVPDGVVGRFVPDEKRSRLGQACFFCETPTCGVAYFDAMEDSIASNELVQSVYPKDPSAPICSCFQVGTDVIDLDLEEGGIPHRTRDLVFRAKSPEAHCGQCSPTGRSCAAAVQRYYLRGLQR
jgi:hypothetical protein